jgi:hypothetical protein
MTKRRDDRAYALYLLAGCGAILLLYMITCVVVDPYGVFGLFDYTRTNTERSLRYAKTGYIAEHCSEYRGILFGNSRSLQFKDSDLERDFTERYFNFAVHADSFEGIDEKLAWLMPRCGFRDVLLVVDVEMMLARARDQGLFLRQHYYISHGSKFEFYAPYLLVPPKILIKTVIEQLATAGFSTANAGLPIEEREGWHGILPIQYACYVPDPVDQKIYLQNLEAFHRIVQRVKADGRSIQVLIAPLNQNLLAHFDYRAVADFVTEIVEGADGAAVFTGYNELALADNLYFDLGHFGVGTAALLLRITAAHGRLAPLMGWYARDDVGELHDRLVANGAERAAACTTGGPMISATPPRIGVASPP